MAFLMRQVLVGLLVLAAGVFSAQPNCTDYCPIITELCNGTNAQYYNRTGASSPTYCETICPTFDYTNGTASWDTYDCRRHHLTYIQQGQNATFHCPHAGPTGGGLCSDYCNYYCDLVADTCTGSNLIYPNKAWCLLECYAYPTNASANLYTLPVWDDTLDCRAYHANLASSYVPTSPSLVSLHCGHANASGGNGVCGDGCQNYCDAMMLYCNQSFGSVQFTSTASCMQACAAYPHDYSGTPMLPVTTGNSFECRKYHVILAAMGQTALHCSHASMGGGGTCVKSDASEHAKMWMLTVLLPIVWLIFNY